MAEMSRPVVKTSITTAIGFGSFALSPIGAVQAFGVFTAAGVLFCMLFSLTVVPICLGRLPRSWLVAPRRRTPDPVAKPGAVWARVARFSARRRLAVGVVTVVLTGGAAYEGQWEKDKKNGRGGRAKGRRQRGARRRVEGWLARPVMHGEP